MTQNTPPLETQFADQLKEQRQIRVEHKATYQFIGAVIVLLLGIWIGSQRYSGDSGFETNLYTELLSIGVTVFILDRLNIRRTKAEATRQRKSELFLQLGSQSSDSALEAKRQLEIEGWFETALAQKHFPRANWQFFDLRETNLMNVRLAGANLSKAELWKADLTCSQMNDAIMTSVNLSESILICCELKRATMTQANLQKANLSHANLYNAILSHANLRDADLTDAFMVGIHAKHTDLRGATLKQADISKATLISARLENCELRGANISSANMYRATLDNADLKFANLSGSELSTAKLTDTRFNEYTVLPDGTLWTPKTDMARFTDPFHRHYWRSDNPDSPAYRATP